ncbi:DNA polymerase III beta subunit [invertebrate metagenome]|uniref:DNA polymerase III beta subunit n=1 Tax=invertebrate metagenome TaxID=1711999 RepID=A0A484HCF5_9ZZZZ
MKFTIERSIFLKSLSRVQGVVERRATVPILANIYLETRQTGLELRATDMDLEISETVFCEIERTGSATAPAYMVYDIMRKLPENARVNLEHYPEESQLVLCSGKSKFILKSLPVTDFPALVESTLPISFKVRAIDLRSLIERTRFAMSTEATRYYLNGIYLYAVHNAGVGVLRAIATDGYRLALAEVSLPKDAYNMPSVILPRKTVEELRTLIEETTTEITTSLSNTKIRFAFGQNTILISKLIDGTFPDCERVIPVNNNKTIEVNAKALAEAVSRVSTVMATDKARAVKLEVVRDSLVLSASNTTTNNNATDELDAVCDCTPLSIGFNSRYLLDILGQMTGDTVRFAVSDPSSPMMVREVADDSALYILMPMRV